MLYIILIVVNIVNTILRAFLIKLFYGWFILTHWSNLPNLSWIACLGLSYFIYSVSPWQISLQDDHDNDDIEDVLKKLFKLNFIYFFTMCYLLVAGFIVHSFM